VSEAGWVRTVVRASVQVGAVVLSACALAGCSTDTGIDASVSPDGSSEAETGTLDGGAGPVDAGTADGGAGTLDGGESEDVAPRSDAPAVEDCANGADDDGDGLADCEDRACVLDTRCAYSCGSFTEAPAGWTLATGLRAVVVADADDGLVQPVGIAFAGDAFGGDLYVSDQAAATVFRVDVATGATTTFAASAAFPMGARLLTAIVWDEARVNDGNLYVTDSITDGDQDAIVYRLDPSGAASVFVRAPGPGLDSIYAMAFAPPGFTPAGLFVAGDTDSLGADWGVFERDGTGLAFSEVSGIEGIAFDPSGRYGRGPIAARPNGGGYAGDGSLTPLDGDGAALTPLASSLGGVHANVVAPAGLFGGEMLAASWSTGTIFRVSVAGEITTLVSGVSLSNYDANVLAVSPDGRVLLVADRNASRIVCVEEL
jgi:hypothetical protein